MESSSTQTKMAISKVVGIQNMGNSCFMAATLQMVAHTPGVREIVGRHKCRSKEFCLPCFLRLLLDAIQNEQVDVFSPVRLYNSLPDFVSGYSLRDQFDAVEFFQCFVTQMGLLGSDIKPLFEADLTEKVQCDCCGYRKNTNGKYLTIPIAIEGKKTVTELMHMFQHPKDNRICPNCESGNSANCTLHFEFERMPQILSIQVVKGTDTSLIYENEIQLKDHLGESHTYSLYGAVIHIAHDTVSGHYLSLLRRENSWIKFDDTKVTIVKELNYGEQGNFLFFQKVMQKSKDLKLRTSSRITKKETSSPRKVMQKSEDLKRKKSSRIAKIETSSSRKPQESQLERLIPITPILPKSHSIPQPNNKLSIFVRGRRSSRMGSKSSWEKVMQQSKYLKVRSSRIAKKSTSSSRKLTEECINEMDDVGLMNVLISLKDDRSFHGDVASMKTAANMEDVAVNDSVGTAMGSSGRSERSDLMAAQVQIAKDNEAEKPSNATAEPSTWAELGISHVDHAIPSPLQESFKAFLARFDEDVGCDCPASHFFKFTGSKTSIQRFLVPLESAPILEQLRSKHEDFVGQLEVGSGTGNFLLSLLAAIIMDMKSTSVASLTEVRLFEWRGTVRDLIKLGMAVTFLRLHLRRIAKEWFIWTRMVFLKDQISKISKLEAELAFMLLERAQLPESISDEAILNGDTTYGLL